MLKQRQACLQSELAHLSQEMKSKGLKLNKQVLDDESDSDSSRSQEDEQATLKPSLLKKGTL